MALRRKAGRNGGTKKIVSVGKQAGCSTASPVVIDGDPVSITFIVCRPQTKAARNQLLVETIPYARLAS